jgi:hypothetical protein
MNPEVVFSIVNLMVLPQWLLMIVAPKWKGTQWLVKNPLIPGALVLVYLTFLASAFGVEGGGFGSLSEVMVLFTIEEAVLAGWVHYLAFDLLVGSWVFKDAQSRNFNHFLLIPCLLFTFMAGPFGWGLYRVLRYFLGNEK